MKKFIALLLATLIAFSLAACKKDPPAPTPATVGDTLKADFLTRITDTPDLPPQDLAEALLQNNILPFSGATMPIEPGLLTGFGNNEILGFKDGVMFSPMIGAIPFIGYIFLLEDDTTAADLAAFEQTLKSSGNLRWNICTEAEQLVVASSGNTVFFVMCPMSFEDDDVDDEEPFEDFTGE